MKVKTQTRLVECRVQKVYKCKHQVSNILLPS